MSDSDSSSGELAAKRRRKEEALQRQRKALEDSDETDDDSDDTNQPVGAGLSSNLGGGLNNDSDSDADSSDSDRPIAHTKPQYKPRGKMMPALEKEEKNKGGLVRNFFDDTAAVDEESDEESYDEDAQNEDDLVGEDEGDEAMEAAKQIDQNRALDAMQAENRGEQMYANLIDKYVSREDESIADGGSISTMRTGSDLKFGMGMAPTATEQLAGLEQHNPTIEDPNIWYVKCRIGEEKNLCMLLIRKAIKAAAQGAPLQIKSVISPDYLQGYICIEAYKKAHMMAAIEDVNALRPGVYKNQLIKKTDMTDILKVGKSTMRQELKEGSWVRMKRSLYKEDLAKGFLGLEKIFEKKIWKKNFFFVFFRKPPPRSISSTTPQVPSRSN